LEKAMRHSDLKKHWDALFNSIMKLPPPIRNIVFDDVNTAIKNRVAIMEMIEQKFSKKARQSD
jgi:hypothetical protein